MSRTLRLTLALALLGAAACRGAPDPAPPATPAPEEAFPVTLVDDEGVEATLEAPPRRIVTFAPSHTETVFALGLGDRVVGVSGPFDDFPPEAQEIEPVGGPGGTEPSIETVVALDPDVVLTAFIGGEWKERLRESGIPVFTTLAEDLPDAVADIRTVGRLLGAAGAAEHLADEMATRADRVQEQTSDTRVTCFLELSDLFTVGPGALEFDLLERAGCDPVTAEAREPYPQWSVEQLVADDPHVFLASEAAGPLERVTDRPGIRDLTAVEEGRAYLVDGDVVSRPGPRLADGLEELADVLHR